MSNFLGKQFGNYHLTKHLGGGGFADVYLGEHIHINNKLVAIKVLTTQLTHEEIEKFRTEANTMALLDHPNIVRILDFGVEGGKIPYLVMTYAPNGTLRLSQGKRMSPAEVLLYVKQIASALQYVHDKKHVHLDIKPENILLGQNHEALLSDFGIAMVARKTGQPKIKNILGTVDYMAPEHVQGQPRPASDQYALAIVVYEWLCGTCPFQGSTSRDIAVQHLVTPPSPLRLYVPTIPPALEEVVLKALAKKPEDRYPTVMDFAKALEQAIVMQAPSHSPSPSMPVVPPPIQGTPNVIGLALPPTLHVNPPSSLPPVQIGGIGLAPTLHVTPIQPLPSIQGLGSNIYTYRGHTAGVYVVTWSPDSKRIASTSDDWTIQVWDAITGRNVFSYVGHDFLQVWSVRWSPNGKYIASAGADQIIHVWDAVTGNKILVYSGHYDQNNPFGSTCVITWSPDSKYIASGGDDQKVQVWGSSTGNPFFTYRGHVSNKPDEISGINTVDWSPDEQRIASAGGSDKTIQIWDAMTGNNVRIYGNRSKRIHALTWSPDGKYIASVSTDQVVQIWDVATGNTALTYRGHSKQVRAIAWSPDSVYIASVSGDKTLQAWNALTGDLLFIGRKHDDKVKDIAWSPDGQYIASASDDMTVRVWQAK
jgi:serine/threonine protein kinase